MNFSWLGFKIVKFLKLLTYENLMNLWRLFPYVEKIKRYLSRNDQCNLDSKRF